MTDQPTETHPITRISTAGSVDNGKSTLIGRLLYDTNNVYQDQWQEATHLEQQKKGNNLAFSFLVDGLKSEREQGITIDVAHRYFTTSKGRFIILDAPGHQQYTRNMVVATSQADVSIILIDVTTELTSQSRRHIFIASILRVPHIIMAINKMDLIHFDEGAFLKKQQEILAFCNKLDITSLYFIPISAIHGDNITAQSANMPWFKGGHLLHLLENLSLINTQNLKDFRLPIQWTSPPMHQPLSQRHFAGKIASGTLRKNDTVTILPDHTSTRVSHILTHKGEVPYAFAGQSVMITLADDINVHRGSMLCHPQNKPPKREHACGYILWFHDHEPLRNEQFYTILHAHHHYKIKLTPHYIIDTETLHKQKNITQEHHPHTNNVCFATIHTATPLFADSYQNNRALGRFIIIDDTTGNTIGAGILSDRPVPEHQQKHTPPIMHATPKIYWFYGLSGSGKTTLATALKHELQQKNAKVYLLDADIIRKNLNKDLGFTIKDREENIRRLAEIAKLFHQEGYHVIVTSITPLNSMRDLIKDILKNHPLIDIFVNTPLTICQKRDPKGLYKQASQGHIKNFTSISSPFEAPITPATLTVHPQEKTIPEIINDIMKKIHT